MCPIRAHAVGVVLDFHGGQKMVRIDDNAARDLDPAVGAIRFNSQGENGVGAFTLRQKWEVKGEVTLVGSGALVSQNACLVNLTHFFVRRPAGASAGPMEVHFAHIFKNTDNCGAMNSAAAILGVRENNRTNKVEKSLFVEYRGLVNGTAIGNPATMHFDDAANTASTIFKDKRKHGAPIAANMDGSFQLFGRVLVGLGTTDDDVEMPDSAEVGISDYPFEPLSSPNGSFVSDLHFSCYEVKARQVTPIAVELEDRFGAGPVDVTKPRRLCFPADKNGENPTMETRPEHLTGYEIRRSITPVRGVVAVDQLVEHVLDVSRAQLLLVPSRKVVSPPLSPILHYECYKAKRSRGAPRFVPQTVTITDQFGTGSAVLRKPLRFCTPVDKNDEDPTSPASTEHLVCYRASRAPFGASREYRVDQFGLQTLDLTHGVEVCLPAVSVP